DAEYSGDAAFAAGGATTRVQLTLPPAGSAAAIVLTAPNTVSQLPPDAQGPVWQTSITLRELAGVPPKLTGFTIHGQAQKLGQYFSSHDIPANSSLNTIVVFRNLTPPAYR